MPPLKIFISHSHDEEWLAEMIAAELRDIETDPRYYESNETGAPIDERVRAEIEGCDEFLILLTPTSVFSHWVLYELAIAHYLGKQIRPFFMYVREQDIPPAARNYLRRPIGEIQRYFDELRALVLKRFAADAVSDLPPESDAAEILESVLQVGGESRRHLVPRLRRLVRTAPSGLPPPRPQTKPPSKPE